MGPDGLDTSELAALAGNAAIGVHYTSIGQPASAYPGATQFIVDYQNRFAEPPQPFAAQAYDATGVCLQSIERAIEQNSNQLPTRSQVKVANHTFASVIDAMCCICWFNANRTDP
jgi:branched-chain amino acid transport system substrate-binding protein